MIATAHAALDQPTPPTCQSESRRRSLRDRCMKELSRLDRLIIVLYYYEQLTCREVAAVLDLPEQQIETRRAALARRLAGMMSR